MAPADTVFVRHLVERHNRAARPGVGIDPDAGEVAADDSLWHGIGSCPCRAGSWLAQATVQVDVGAEGTLAPTRAQDPGGERAPFRNPTIAHPQQTGGAERRPCEKGVCRAGVRTDSPAPAGGPGRVREGGTPPGRRDNGAGVRGFAPAERWLEHMAEGQVRQPSCEQFRSAHPAVQARVSSVVVETCVSQRLPETAKPCWVVEPVPLLEAPWPGGGQTPKRSTQNRLDSNMQMTQVRLSAAATCFLQQ